MRVCAMTTYRSSWQIQRTVVFALLLRELKTRFGKYRLGYAWALIEPLAHVLALAAIFGFVLKRTLPGIDFPVFLATGIVPWLSFSNMVTRGMTAVTANRGLFSYRQVKPADAVIARMLLEGLIHLVTYVALLLLGLWLGYTVTITDPLQVFAALGLLFVFSFGVGLFSSVVGTLYEESQKVIPILLRPLYLMSGIFFALEHIPQDYRIYLLWNPVLHALELSRTGFFSSFTTVGGSWLYLSGASVCSLFVGLMFYRRHAVRLLTT